MDVGTWLGGLGLGQYETAFRENQIEAGTLPELNERVLKDIGVPLGHRLRMLRAIRELAAQAAIAVQPAAGQSALREGAERRHMTVMFCDLVGLATLTAELDPEDMADLLRASQSAIAAAVTRFDATLPNGWATAPPSISAIRARTRTTPNARCVLALRCWMPLPRLGASMRCNWPYASASRAASSWLAN
jgi:hypothetical protein